MKRILLLSLLLVSGYCHAQKADTTKYETKTVYQYAIRDYLARNPTVILTAKDGKEKIAFFKRHNYGSNFGDTLSGVKLVQIDVATFGDSLLLYLKKKKTKITILDVQQPILREAQGQLWVMPMSATADPKKKTIGETEYAGTGCKYTFAYYIMSKEYYQYKSTECKTLE